MGLMRQIQGNGISDQQFLFCKSARMINLTKVQYVGKVVAPISKGYHYF